MYSMYIMTVYICIAMYVCAYMVENLRRKEGEIQIERERERGSEGAERERLRERTLLSINSFIPAFHLCPPSQDPLLSFPSCFISLLNPVTPAFPLPAYSNAHS
jgi:hypothetical protein